MWHRRGHEFESQFEHFFEKKCLRVRLIINMSPWVPRIWIQIWVGTYDRIRRPVNRNVLIKPISRRSTGGKCRKAYPGLGNRSIFYTGSSVGMICSTITTTPVRGGGARLCRRKNTKSRRSATTLSDRGDEAEVLDRRKRW